MQMYYIIKALGGEVWELYPKNRREISKKEAPGIWTVSIHTILTRRTA